MAEEKKDEKKIIVDDDWKQQAQKEKEELAAQEKTEETKADDAKGGRGPLPKGDFAALVSMLVTQAFYSLGLVQFDGQDEKKDPDLELAKYNIDMLETIEEKTKGNLSEEEQAVLNNTLDQLRMAYVKLADK